MNDYEQISQKVEQQLALNRWLVRGTNFAFVLVVCGLCLSLAGFFASKLWLTLLGSVLVVDCFFGANWLLHKAKRSRVEAEKLLRMTRWRISESER